MADRRNIGAIVAREIKGKTKMGIIDKYINTLLICREQVSALLPKGQGAIYLCASHGLLLRCTVWPFSTRSGVQDAYCLSYAGNLYQYSAITPQRG